MERETTQTESHKSSFLILDQRFEIRKYIDYGLSARVYEGFDLKFDKYVALKMFNENRSDLSIFNNEVAMLQKAQSLEGVIQLVDFNCDGKIKDSENSIIAYKAYIAFEYCSNKNLKETLMLTRAGVGEEYGRIIAKTLLKAIMNLHSIGIVHRDIKLDNILINQNWDITLCDLGFAMKANEVITRYCGTREYACPQLLNVQGNYDLEKADIFAFGVTLFEIVTRKAPFFKEATELDTYYCNLSMNRYQQYWALIEKDINPVSNEFKSLINGLLDSDENTRFSMIEIWNHAWFNLETGSLEELKDYMKGLGG